jgi:hypothetical protein
MIAADWYTFDAFSPKVGGGFGMLGIFQANEKNSPVLIQKERLAHINAFRSHKTDADLIADFHALVTRAGAAGRPVYAVLTDAEAAAFRRRYITPGYEMIQRQHWTEPCAVFPHPTGGSRRGDARSDSPLVPDTFLGEPLIRWQPQDLKMYELRAATSAASPGTANPAMPSPVTKSADVAHRD